MFAKTISSILIISTLAMGTAALAQPNRGVEQDVGYVTAISLEDHTVTLSDGVTYQFPFGYALKTFNEGQKVAITFDQVGGTNLATGMSFTN